ncbi:phosphatidylglycerophosphatase A [Polynucleobacter necessarius]|uniref:phosphatidylglycerophosphatase A family protein n=1 Tax=Polynucleobacter necessarius TaxID=576610 RepID=UPI000E08FDF0|nr:phosphatidylglycerophosphatase A [Polynucleobacter necessarius]HAT39179.1 phosphatidylglycerophosphatase A [Polynucleobacter sp.]
MTNRQTSSEVQPNLKWVFQTASRTIAFGFGSGLSPIAPGTAGTLWAWATFLVGEYFLSTADFLWLIGGGILFGFWICGHVSEELGKKDFGGIVWDEIVAFWLVLIIMPTNIWMQVIAFALFRFFDAVKPGPIGAIDHHFKSFVSDNFQHSTFLELIWRGFGIVIDDLAAAFCTLLAIALIQLLI